MNEPTPQKLMSLQDALAGIAQGVVNIDEGMIRIHPCSYIHRSMAAVCEMIPAAKIEEVERFIAFCRSEEERKKS